MRGRPRVHARRPFERWERAYLREWYAVKTWGEIATGLRRCVTSVYLLASQMGLGPKPRCGMSEAEAQGQRKSRRGGQPFHASRDESLYRCQDCCQLTRVGPACGCAPERRSA